MKTIIERAKEAIMDAFYPDEILPARVGHLVNIERRGFIEGAISEHKELTRWNDIPAKDGFATDEALDEIFSNLPRLVRDNRDGCIELINYDNAVEWRGDLERNPDRYQWRQIIE